MPIQTLDLQSGVFAWGFVVEFVGGSVGGPLGGLLRGPSRVHWGVHNIIDTISILLTPKIIKWFQPCRTKVISDQRQKGLE